MRRLPALLSAAGLLCCRCVPALGAAAAASTSALRSLAASSSAEAQREAFVTFVVSEDYVLGARVLGQSLRESGTQRYALARARGGPACHRLPRGAAAAYPRPAPGLSRARHVSTRAAALTRRCQRAGVPRGGATVAAKPRLFVRRRLGAARGAGGGEPAR